MPRFVMPEQQKAAAQTSKKIVFILFPIILFTLATAGTLFYYIFKQNITKTVYKDLESMVSICKIYTDEMFDSKMAQADVIGNLKRSFDKIIIGKDGFLFIVDPEGNLLVHQRVGTINWLKEPFIRHIIAKKKGLHRYISPKTRTYKIAAFDYVSKGNFIIVATAFEDDFFEEPLREIVIYLFISFSVVSILGTVIFIAVLKED